MANPPTSVTGQRRLVSAARAIVTYQVGIPIGCRRIEILMSQIAELSQVPGMESTLSILREYRKAAFGLPCGSERLKWSRAALRETDRRLEEINVAFRDQIFDACCDLIEAWGAI